MESMIRYVIDNPYLRFWHVIILDDQPTAPKNRITICGWSPQKSQYHWGWSIVQEHRPGTGMCGLCWLICKEAGIEILRKSEEDELDFVRIREATRKYDLAQERLAVALSQGIRNIKAQHDEMEQSFQECRQAIQEEWAKGDYVPSEQSAIEAVRVTLPQGTRVRLLDTSKVAVLQGPVEFTNRGGKGLGMLHLKSGDRAIQVLGKKK
jgi:hypothetical protein